MKIGVATLRQKIIELRDLVAKQLLTIERIESAIKDLRTEMVAEFNDRLG